MHRMGEKHPSSGLYHELAALQAEAFEDCRVAPDPVSRGDVPPHVGFGGDLNESLLDQPRNQEPHGLQVDSRLIGNALQTELGQAVVIPGGRPLTP
jgi:hypothetical protein